MRKFFTPTPETLEELKSMYRKLAVEHHPDKGGETATMQKINAEYDALFPLLKDVHKNKDGETYRKESTETADHFKSLIDELMRMDDIVIEVIGCFVWVTGDTRPHREKLKALKFQWHSKKIAWYLKPEDYRKRSHKDYDLDTIRAMYGSDGQVHSKGTTKIDEASA